jgi:hypothetical protein
MELVAFLQTPLSDRQASEKFLEIYSIKGNDPQQCRDGLYLHSAFKSGANVFLDCLLRKYMHFI